MAAMGFARAQPILPPNQKRAEEYAMAQAKWTWSGLAVVAALVLAATASPAQSQTPAGATVLEGARLITGDGAAPIENSAVIVTGDRITAVGRRGEGPVPPRSARGALPP